MTGTELGYKGRQMGCDLNGEVMEFSHEIFRVKGKQNKQEESFLDREKQYYKTWVNFLSLSFVYMVGGFSDKTCL